MAHVERAYARITLANYELPRYPALPSVMRLSKLPGAYVIWPLTGAFGECKSNARARDIPQLSRDDEPYELSQSSFLELN